MSVMELNPHLREHLPASGAFDWLMNCSGVEHRNVKSRRTVEFEVGGRRYFIKAHRSVGWKEIFKDLFSLRLPIVSARNEWEAIERLTTLGVNTLKLAGKGERGSNPASRQSFVVTEAMSGMTNLEYFPRSFKGLSAKKTMLLKRAFLEKVADIARIMHGGGMNHRDFYLCHFIVRDRDWGNWNPSDELELVLIDLHRVQIRNRVPRRWLVKDLGGLFFSGMDCGLTRSDLFRFLKRYRQRPLREILRDEKALWQGVKTNAEKMYRGFHKKAPPQYL